MLNVPTGRIIRCPACEIQYDQDASTGDDGTFSSGKVPCEEPGARYCSAVRRWADTERPDDGFIDELAVDYAVRGVRVVRLSREEAAIALVSMVRRDPDISPQEAGRRLGLTVRQLAPLLERAGLAFSQEPAAGRPRFVAAGAA